MSVEVKRFLRARRDRCLGSILGSLEEDLRGRVSRPEWEEIRQLVLDAVNGYHDSVLDLMKSEDEGSVRNEAIVDLLERVEAELKTRRRPATARS